MNDKDCIFCKILRKEIPATVVYEDELILAFMDIMPVNPGHVLIIPKEHKQFISEVDTKTASRMFELARKINTATRQSSLKCEAVNFMISDGVAAGQEVFHCHMHCIPRYKGDGVRFVFPSKSDGIAAAEDLSHAAKAISEKLES